MAFNPENQFLQIRIEYGSLVFLVRTLLYFGLVHTAWKLKATHPYHAAFALGMVGLAICGMVLHSFSDRMIVYPFMLIWGIRAASSLATNS